MDHHPAAAQRSFTDNQWTDCYLALTSADRSTPLGTEGVQQLAAVAHLIGKESDSLAAWTRAYGELLAAGDSTKAAKCAFWLAFQLLNAGEYARGGGWLARAQRLVDGVDCAERGYVEACSAHQARALGDPDKAYGMFVDAIEAGRRFGDPTLLALGSLGLAQTCVDLGDTDRGIGLLDEVMVSVTAGEVEPVIAGLAYCAVITACRATFDLRRAQEWTVSLSRWCEGRPDLVPYRGLCLIHRAELMQLHGAWSDAVEEAQHAAERLADSADRPVAGVAYYLLADLHRLQGEWSAAEDLYRLANRCGRQPQPGLALLRLAQGKHAAAATGIRRAAEEAEGQLGKAKLLPACVEIYLAAGDVRAARAAADELAAIAAAIDRPYLDAVATHCDGAVLLAEGNGHEAVGVLRRAWSGWQHLDAPYEAGRVRVLLAQACRELGDEDGYELELDAARAVFEQLGAGADLTHLAALSGEGDSRLGLTAREIQVLGLLATGATNRAIAAELVISEKTVARHLSNIFAKLDLPSRAAATAYAYEHRLV